MQYLDLRLKEHRHKFYKSRDWRTLRELVLSEEPLCKKCLEQGLLVPGRNIDHIIPLSLRPDLALDRSNLQNLCSKCHAEKTNKENNSFGKKKTEPKTYKPKWDIDKLLNKK